MKPTASIDLVPSVKLNVAVSRPPLLLSCHPKIDIPRMNDHTDERKRLAYIENSKPQQYGGTVEQNRNRSTRIYDGLRGFFSYLSEENLSRISLFSVD